MVGRLLDALDASPAATNTIIVFWSDNGCHFGEKQHLHKMTLWARSTRLPLVVVASGVTRQDTRTSPPVSFVDLFPTLNELCGLPQPDELEGTSLVPLLKNPSQTWERPALVTYYLQGNHAVCNERWRYIRYADGGEELYDHANDPNEWTNLAGKPEFAAVKAKLADWLTKTDAPSLRGKAKRVKGKGRNEKQHPVFCNPAAYLAGRGNRFGPIQRSAARASGESPLRHDPR
jgi:arylsulfatase A-like enzyme